jgi:hypothetical protein
MGKRRLRVTIAVMAGVLVLGGVLASAWSGEAEARYGERNPYTEADRGVRPQGGQTATAPCTVTAAPTGDVVYAGELDESETEALLMALDDEYKAWSVYDQVIADLGTVRPFVSVQKAEENHIAALVTLFDRYGLEVPANDWPGNVPTFETAADACTAGVQAEIGNASLYDELLSMIDNPDIVRVFTALQQASQTMHLPAFEQCAW